MSDTPRRKVYFASDMHLGSPSQGDPMERERRVVRWLKSIREDAAMLILVGDIFDYWFEYKTVAPQGFVRLLGTLAELSDAGVEIHYFTGNHDIWLFGYLEREIGFTLHREAARMELLGKSFFIAHGDEFETENKSYLFLRKVFHARWAQKLYSLLHPDLTVRFAQSWSRHSRKKGTERYPIVPYRGENEEYLTLFAKSETKKLGDEAPDFFIFGHRHLLLDLMITRQTRVVILGDWLHYYSYGEWDGKTFVLNQFEEDKASPMY
ncbi:MAG: UDP-2,3-diacylglucosamine diphosphatase [Porphyromonas sp.]|nr:UDP-2,3-diacylglucosamine diphosphatase [Bacteroidales bacterium]MDY3100475.1 UDP-2,3-diacylglucosamine diphosphatase [Porphyromonas sp.]